MRGAWGQPIELWQDDLGRNGAGKRAGVGNGNM